MAEATRGIEITAGAVGGITAGAGGGMTNGVVGSITCDPMVAAVGVRGIGGKPMCC